jgi:hypothetical protein
VLLAVFRCNGIRYPQVFLLMGRLAGGCFQGRLFGAFALIDDQVNRVDGGDNIRHRDTIHITYGAHHLSCFASIVLGEQWLAPMRDHFFDPIVKLTNRDCFGRGIIQDDWEHLRIFWLLNAKKDFVD